MVIVIQRSWLSKQLIEGYGLMVSKSHGQLGLFKYTSKLHTYQFSTWVTCEHNADYDFIFNRIKS